VSGRKGLTREQAWTERLGIDSTDDLTAELLARFEHLARFVLTEEVPRPGTPVSAEAAAAHGELWVLTGFLNSARHVLTLMEVKW